MKKIIVIVLLAISFGLNAQNPVMEGPKLWKTLGDVKYELAKDEYGDVYLPVFNSETKAAEGQMVEVEGFIIPLEGMFKPTQLILSPWLLFLFRHSDNPFFLLELFRLSQKEQNS